MLEFITSKSHLVYSLEYEDKFKNEGVVGMSIVNIKGKEAIIDTFLLSCRVLSRDIEFILLNRILKDLREREVKNVIGHYVPTKKNNIVKDFYSFSGFYADVNGKFIKDIEK